MDSYCFQVVTQSLRQLSGGSRKTSFCSSRSQSLEVPIILKSSLSQSDDFKRLSQNKPEDKPKSHNSWNPNLSQTSHNS